MILGILAVLGQALGMTLVETRCVWLLHGGDDGFRLLTMCVVVLYMLCEETAFGGSRASGTSIVYM